MTTAPTAPNAAARPPQARTAKAPTADDTRERILRSAMYLFRKRGYHATGLNEILLHAQAPKGSLYHHFPGGKQAIGVAVIDRVTHDIVQMFSIPKVRTTAALVTQAGQHMAAAIERTNHEICAMYAAFLAERNDSPLIAQAVAQGYGQMIDQLAQRLVQDGLAMRQARERATMVVSLLEGSSLMSLAQQDGTTFRQAIKLAAQLCTVDA